MPSASSLVFHPVSLLSPPPQDSGRQRANIRTRWSSLLVDSMRLGWSRCIDAIRLISPKRGIHRQPMVCSQLD